MDIEFQTERLKDLCGSLKELSKKYGELRAKAILQRLTQLRNAQHLFEFSSLPPKPRCHELGNKKKVNRSGQFAIALDGAWRLIIEPCDEPLPLDKHGKLVWDQCCVIRVLSVENYHD